MWTNFQDNKMSLLIINVCMSCKNNYVDDEYIGVRNAISQTMYKYNPSHIVIGGDFNFDFSRTSHTTNILPDFIMDFNLFKFVDLTHASVPSTFISHTNATSISIISFYHNTYIMMLLSVL